MSESVSPSARIAAAYKSLVPSTEDLNGASDEFSKPVAHLDDVLQKLNVGLVTWERVQGVDDDGYSNYWSRDVGYAKVNGKWGLAIRETSGNHGCPADATLEVWLFNEAPRSFRIEAFDKIPELLERLIKVADKTAKKLREKAGEANQFVNAILEAEAELKHQANTNPNNTNLNNANPKNTNPKNTPPFSAK